MHNGRLFKMSRDLVIGAAACLVLASVMPLSFWQGLGETASSLVVLAAAAAVTGVVVWRSRSAGVVSVLSVTSAETTQ
jgi:hypothetical protein